MRVVESQKIFEPLDMIQIIKNLSLFAFQGLDPVGP